MPDERVFMEFSKRQQWRRFGSIAVVGVLILSGAQIIHWFAFPLAVVAFGLFVYRTWRCPVCEGLLGREDSYTYCPRCGARLKA